MSIEENKAIARRWNEELFNNANPGIIDELAHADYVSHPGMTGREAFKQGIIQGGAAFSDWSITIDDILAEGDRVAFRWTVHATHAGEYMGVAPTGKRLIWTGMSIYRIADGKVAEDWHINDQPGFLKQLGIALDVDQITESTWD